MNVIRPLLMVGLSVLILACQDVKQDKSISDSFVGCYSIVAPNAIADIKISQHQDSFVMQMAEEVSGDMVWDTPEPLQKIELEQGWQRYFATNVLNLDKADVQAILERPDQIMALAQVYPKSSAIKRLDSEYVVYIFRGSNTIYKVPCG